MGCDGLHCDGCRNGGPAGPAAAVVVLLLFIAVGLRKVWPQLVSAVEIIGWTLAGIAGAVIIVTGGVVTARVVRARRARRAGQQITSGLYRPGYRIVPGTVLGARPGKVGARPAIGRTRRPAWLYGLGCCEHWTPEHGCSAGHTGRPAMSLQARDEWPDDRRGQR
jgi:protein-S-isoprenylcysteine O-methyltransferase Ste14